MKDFSIQQENIGTKKFGMSIYRIAFLLLMELLQKEEELVLKEDPIIFLIFFEWKQKVNVNLFQINS